VPQVPWLGLGGDARLLPTVRDRTHLHGLRKAEGVPGVMATVDSDNALIEAIAARAEQDRIDALLDISLEG
jgi:hypothetical protein